MKKKEHNFYKNIHKIIKFYMKYFLLILIKCLVIGLQLI